MNPRSIRFRLAAWHAGLLIVVFLALGGLMYASLKDYLQRSLGETQFRRARQIAETLLANVDRTGEGHVTNEINAWFAPELNDRFIRITRGDASVLYVSRALNDQAFNPSLVPRPRNGGGDAAWRVETVSDQRRFLIAAFPFPAGDGRRFLVEVGAPLEPVEAILHRLVTLLGAALAVMMVVGAGCGYVLVTNALAPVDRISRGAEQISLHNLKERLPIAWTGDELERLSISLNNMIARLEDALTQNRRFLADASHELRTPLTIIRGELESILDRDRRNPETEARAMSALEEAERLAMIVEGLFAISRLDAGEAQREWVKFDLGRLAAGATEQMCLLAEDKDVTLTCDVSTEVFVDGDRARVKQVIVNLLDNAIKYTSAGGAVRLSVHSSTGKAVLEVEDNGIGIPAEAQPHIFERFFRVDKARSREMGGAGLGLSIVKSICAAHGGRVDVQSTEGRGSRFKVELPLAAGNHRNTEPNHGNGTTPIHA